MERMREITSYIHERVSVTVCLKTDGTTTGQDGASLPQLATISSPWWWDGANDGTAWRRDR